MHVVRVGGKKHNAVVHCCCAFGGFCVNLKCFGTTCEALQTTVRVAPQAAALCESWRIDLFVAAKFVLLQSNSCLLGCERVMEAREEFHFSWIYTFSVMLSSLQN